MINLIQTDEYGYHYATDTFLTTEDAKQALETLECALDDAISAAHSYRLHDLINQLREQIELEESDENSN